MAATAVNEIIHSVVGDIANNLTTNEDVPAVTCLHAEADTGIQPCSPYIVCFCQLVPQQLSFSTQKIWTTMYKQHYVADETPGILCLKRKHNLIGCEHNSGFYGASKKVIADRLEKSNEAQHLLL